MIIQNRPKPGTKWLQPRMSAAVVGAAHLVGIPTTATMMFGHLEGTEHWARHLLAIGRLQFETGGFTEFVPLRFAHMEATMYRRG